VKYPALFLAAAALIAAAPTQQPTPAPTSSAGPSPTASAEPSASPASDINSILNGYGGKRGKRKDSDTSATPSPPPDSRKGIDGVWEVQIQRGPKVEYEHLFLVQTGSTISGYYLTKDKQKYPVAGTLDAQSNARIVVTLPDSTTILLEARLQGTTDMLGMFTDAKERVPFTAAYRAKEKFFDNVNAGPGGIGGLGPGGNAAPPP
jgi:hypothetical protein